MSTCDVIYYHLEALQNKKFSPFSNKQKLNEWVNELTSVKSTLAEWERQYF